MPSLECFDGKEIKRMKNNSNEISTGSALLMTLGILLVIGMIISTGEPKCSMSSCDNDAKDGSRYCYLHDLSYGSVLAVGKGNPEWNYSAPHGAGRVMSRAGARKALSLEEYKKEMEGIYTTSVNEDTLDEAPMAYKSLSDIIDVIGESVEVIEVLKPIYNYKASEPAKFGKNMR